MKLKERIKNIGFWVSLISSVILILGAFGVEIAGETESAIINGVCSLLVVFGIVSDPTTGTGYLDGVSTPSELIGAIKTVSEDIQAARAAQTVADADDPTNGTSTSSGAEQADPASTDGDGGGTR